MVYKINKRKISLKNLPKVRFKGTRKNGCGRMIANLKSTRQILDLTIERASNSYLVEFYTFIFFLTSIF